MMMRRKNLYFPIFEKHLAKFGLPDELKYLSIIESALNPRATSRVSAVGLWQFMSATGKFYGLNRIGTLMSAWIQTLQQ
jgi:membrane-bound lytic murein transglycosylase D